MATFDWNGIDMTSEFAPVKDGNSATCINLPVDYTCRSYNQVLLKLKLWYDTSKSVQSCPALNISCYLIKTVQL